MDKDRIYFILVGLEKQAAKADKSGNKDELARLTGLISNLKYKYDL